MKHCQERIMWALLCAALICLLAACEKNREPYVLRKIPLQIVGGQPAEIQIKSLSGDGRNDVGIRCSPEFWQSISTGAALTVELKSSTGKDVQIANVFPAGKPSGPMIYITNVHYLFTISGKSGSDATVEIVFTNAPPKATEIEIIVAKTVTDTL